MSDGGLCDLGPQMQPGALQPSKVTMWIDIQPPNGSNDVASVILCRPQVAGGRAGRAVWRRGRGPVPGARGLHHYLPRSGQPRVQGSGCSGTGEGMPERLSVWAAAVYVPSSSWSDRAALPAPPVSLGEARVRGFPHVSRLLLITHLKVSFDRGNINMLSIFCCVQFYRFFQISFKHSCLLREGNSQSFLIIFNNYFNDTLCWRTSSEIS